MGDDSEDLDRVDIAQQDVRAAKEEATDTPSTAGDVKQRHRDDGDRVGIETPDICCCGQHLEEVAVGEFNALGQTGRARGVELITRVVPAHIDARVLGRMRLDPLLPRGMAGVSRIANHDHGVNGRQVHLVETAQELRTDQQHLGLGIVEDVLHLGWCKPPVHGDGDRVDHAGAEQEREVLRGVLVQERHSSLCGHSGGEHRLRCSP